MPCQELKPEEAKHLRCGITEVFCVPPSAECGDRQAPALTSEYVAQRYQLLQDVMVLDMNAEETRLFVQHVCCHSAAARASLRLRIRARVCLRSLF